MDRNFDSNRLRPGDRGFNYDVRVDFPEEKDDNDWDDRRAPIALHVACACSCALFEKVLWQVLASHGLARTATVQPMPSRKPMT